MDDIFVYAKTFVDYLANIDKVLVDGPTTKIQLSKPRVREAYMTSLCTFLVPIKFHELCCDFYGLVHIYGENGTHMPHELGTPAPLGMACPAGAAAPARWHVFSPKHLLSRWHNLDEQDQPRKHRFDRMDGVRITWINGSTFLADQPPQPSFQGHPERP
jgi:hypothetical protein